MNSPFEHSTYPLVPLGHVAEVRLGKMLQPSPASPTDVATPYLRAGSIAGLEALEELPTMFASKAERAAYGVTRGDLIVAEGGDAGRAAFVPDVPAHTIIQNSLHRVRAASADLRFLRYSLDAVYASGWLEVVCNKSTFGHLTREKLVALRVPAPPLDEQRLIADALDSETARIDELIARKHRVLHLMASRRSSAIGAALESAGCEFLPLRRVVAAFIDYRGATPEKSESGVPLITATNVSDGEIDFSLGEQFVSDQTYAEWMRRGLPEVGDVLLTTEAPLGEVAMISDRRVALAQRIILLRPDRRRVLPQFLYASLRSPVVQADLLSRASGSTVWGIRADRLRDVGVHFTSLSDQQHVVTLMREVEGQYRRARALVDQQIMLLREHRQALITAAVTGELDVAKAAA